MVVDHQGNLGEVFGVEFRDPVENLAFHRLRIFVNAGNIFRVVSHAVPFTPFTQSVSVDESRAVRIVEPGGEGFDELFIVLLEDRVLRHRCFAVGVFRLRHCVLGSGVVDELGGIRTLVTAVDHHAESDRKPPFFGALDQLVDFRIGVVPGILAVRGVQDGPFRADVAG